MGILERILANVQYEVQQRQASRSLVELKELAKQQRPALEIRSVLRQPKTLTVIGEIKRRHPDSGLLANIPNPAQLAKQYQDGGVAMVAVHTEPSHYQGNISDLKQIRQAVELPILQKDFIITPYQIHEARAFGADMVLFIVECLSQTILTSLVERCHSLGMTALLEVHSRWDVLKALEAGAQAIAINGHDLKTETENVDNFSQIVDMIPPEVLLVAEAGVKRPHDIFNYAKEGADAVIIGEAFVTAVDPQKMVSEMVSAGMHPALPCSPRKNR